MTDKELQDIVNKRIGTFTVNKDSEFGEFYYFDFMSHNPFGNCALECGTDRNTGVSMCGNIVIDADGT